MLKSASIALLASVALTSPAARAEEKAPADADKSISISAAPGKGISFAAKDNSFSLTLRPRLQLRETYQKVGGKPTLETNVKTLRLWITGNVLSPDLKYGVQLAFGGNDFESIAPVTGGTSTLNASPIFDAFVNYTKFRDLNIRVGQFFVPFDRARTIREFALQFVDRQQPVQELTLDRDIGVAISSNDLFGAKVLGYNLGIFSGDGRNRFASTVPGLLYVGRLTVHPFGAFDEDQEGDLSRSATPRLAVGVAGAYNQHTARTRSTTGSIYSFDTANYTNLAVDLVFKFRGFSLLSEYLYRQAAKDFVDGPKGTDNRVPREWTRSGRGAFVQAGYLVTSSLEVVGRYSRLLATGKTDPSLVKLVKEQGQEVGGGVNYYLNQHSLKIQADYFHYFGEVKGADRHIARLQMDATF
jgi:hypothetical protein